MTAGTTNGENERLEELLVSDWGEELSDAERAELASLLEMHRDRARDVETAAGAACAAFALADRGRKDPPPELLDRIRRQAIEHFGPGDPGSRPVPDATSPRRDRRRHRRPEAPGTPERSGRAWPGAGWWIALAASVVLAVAGWLPRLGPEPPPPEPIVVEVPVAPPEPPPPKVRLARLAAEADARQIPWTTTEDPWVDEVEGAVVWSNDKQEGYMTFSGLPPNDPREHRYQLWIFDETRDERYPVDGGLFDIETSRGEVVVPIAAKLPVREPKLFAVTLEGPDGVVVSSREHVLVVAQLD